MTLPVGTHVEQCRSCHARIVWARTTATGKKMPVDADPGIGGNIVLTSGPEARVLTKKETSERAALHDATLHRSHFVTCPQRGEWRRNQ